MSKKTPQAARRSTPKAPAARAKAPQPAAPQAPHGRIKVRALRTGYYNEGRVREGDVFILNKPEDFSEKWMEPVHPRTPERITTGKEELRRKHDEILGGKVDGVMPGVSEEDAIDDEQNPLA